LAIERRRGRQLDKRRDGMAPLVSGGMSNSHREALTSLPMGDNFLPVPE